MKRPAVVLKTIEGMLGHVTATANRPYLSQLVKPEILRQGLNSMYSKEIEQRALRLRQLQAEKPLPAESGVYRAFLQALYPQKSGLARLEAPESRFSTVKHALLFKSYMALPRPGARYIAPEDFEHFMKEIMTRRDFVKPGVIGASDYRYHRARTYLRSYRKQLRERWAHRNMCKQILDDLKEAEIPVLRSEKDKFLYYTYFRDRSDILSEASHIGAKVAEKVGQPPGKFNYKLLQKKRLSRNWARKLRWELPKLMPISTVNTLMFLAFRNDKIAAVRDLRRRLKLSPKRRWSTSPNSETFLTLILGNAYGDGGYSTWRDASNAFRHAVILLLRFPHLVDIRTTNSIIHILVKLGAIEEADSIVSAIVSGIDKPLGAEESYIKRLTREDKEKYDTALRDVAEVQQITHRLYPTEKTFLPLLEYYCSQYESQMEHITSILDVMEYRCRLPLTTRMFVRIFEHLARASDSFDEAKEMVARVLGVFDAYHDVSADLRMGDKLGRLNVLPELGNILHSSIKDQPRADFGQGEFLKLSDRLISRIYSALIKIASRTDKTVEARITEQKEEFFKTIKAKKKGIYNKSGEGPTSSELYMRDELNFIKKGFLINLLDLEPEVQHEEDQEREV